MQLRYYQEEAIASIYDYFSRNTGNPIIATPTGTGKGVIIAAFVKELYTAYPNQRVMMLTHVKELIEQNFEKLMTLWPTAPAGIYSAGLKRRDVDAKIIFAGIGSVAKRADEFGHIDLILIDEAHLVGPSANTQYVKFIAALVAINPNLKIIGLTATPWRLGLGPLTDGGIFTDFCYDITGLHAFNRLIADGFLSPLIPKPTVTELPIEGVHVRGGEYVQKELQAAVDVMDITYRACQESIAKAHDRKYWLMFAAGVEHTIHVTDMLNHLGISAVALHSKLSDGERNDAYAGFRAGKYRAMVNNNMATTGFDFSPIDFIGMLRPTISTALWVQMLGRGTRPIFAPGYDLNVLASRLAAIAASDKQNCLVLDFAGNTPRLGPVNDPVMPKKRGKGGGTAPIRLCDTCGTYNHASARICINCGAEFPREIKIGFKPGEHVLIATGKPEVETFKVDRVVFHVHHKQGKPDSIKASYFCGLRRFTEWVCLEHRGFAGKAAREWWRARTSDEPPETTQEALEIVGQLAVPCNIEVWVNKKYPEIMNHEFRQSGQDQTAAT